MTLRLLQTQFTNPAIHKRYLQIGQINPKQRIVKPPKPLWRQRLRYYTEQFGYGILIVAGLAFTAVITFELGSDLYESKEPSKLYDQVSKIVKTDGRIEKLVGSPVKTSYGPPSTRYRLYSNQTFDGKHTNLLIQFYITGPNGTCVCHAEAHVYTDKLDVQQIIVEGLGQRIAIVDKQKVGRFGFGKSIIFGR